MRKISISKLLRIYTLSLVYFLFLFVIPILSSVPSISASEDAPSLANKVSPRSVSEMKQHFNHVASSFFNVCAKVFEPNIATNPYATFIFDRQVTSSLFDSSLVSQNIEFRKLIKAEEVVILEDVEPKINEEEEKQKILRQNISTLLHDPSMPEIDKIKKISIATGDLSKSLMESERFFRQRQLMQADFLWQLSTKENFVRENLNRFPNIQKFFQPKNISKLGDFTTFKLNLFESTSNAIADYSMSQSLSARIKALEYIRGINDLVEVMLNTVGINAVYLIFDHRITIRSKRDQTLLGESVLSESVPRFTLVDLMVNQGQTMGPHLVYDMNKVALMHNETFMSGSYVDNQEKIKLGFTRVKSSSSDLGVLFPQGALPEGVSNSLSLRDFFTESHITYLISLGLYEIGFRYDVNSATIDTNRALWTIQ